MYYYIRKKHGFNNEHTVFKMDINNNLKYISSNNEDVLVKQNNVYSSHITKIINIFLGHDSCTCKAFDIYDKNKKLLGSISYTDVEEKLGMKVYDDNYKWYRCEDYHHIDKYNDKSTNGVIHHMLKSQRAVRSSSMYEYSPLAKSVHDYYSSSPLINRVIKKNVDIVKKQIDEDISSTSLKEHFTKEYL